MAKDPAFLFYPNDWLGGTMFLSRHQKGCYIDLLVAQFNNGPLSLETIKTVLGQDQANWTVLSSKFKQDSNGNFFNERLATEIEKRKKYSESRRENINKRYHKSTHVDTYVESMKVHMENRNRDIIEKGGLGEKWNQTPGTEDLNLELPDIKQGSVMELFLHTKNQKITKAQVLGLWKIFKVQNFCSEKFYQTPNKVYAHFINWCKTQNVDPSTDVNSKFKQPEVTYKTI